MSCFSSKIAISQVKRGVTLPGRYLEGFSVGLSDKFLCEMSTAAPNVKLLVVQYKTDSGPGAPLPRVTCHGSPASSRFVLARAAARRA